MNAAIDIGNTRIKLGFFEKGHLVESKLMNNSEEAVDFLGKNPAKNLISCCVGPQPDWIDSIPVTDKYLVLTKDTPLPIGIDYNTPETLGMDRVAAACGAHRRHKNSNCLVIDMGTCITYDFLDSNSIFQGGAISPGLRMRLKAMHQQTAALPLVEDTSEQVKLTGKSTRESMLSGVIIGIKQEIEGFIRSYHDKVANLQIVFTGGDFRVVENLLQEKHNWVNHLVLEGLNEILEHNS